MDSVPEAPADPAATSLAWGAKADSAVREAGAVVQADRAAVAAAAGVELVGPVERPGSPREVVEAASVEADAAVEAAVVAVAREGVVVAGPMVRLPSATEPAVDAVRNGRPQSCTHSRIRR